jgi:hypothetical protein
VARTDRLGDKLGPRLAQLLVAATVDARRALAPHEARVRQTATQALIDRAGRELSELHAPLWAQLLDQRADDMHPIMRRHVERVASGTHQWESIAGHLQAGATGVLSGALGNVLFPVTSVLNYADRNLVVDAQTGAAAVAAGLAPYSKGDQNAGVWGYRPEAFHYMYELAQQIPDVASLLQLLNRGRLSAPEVRYWLQRSTIPASLHGAVLSLADQLLSPADAALAVLRGNLPHGRAEAIARRNGVSAADFQVLVDNTGEPLGLVQLQEAYRRDMIGRERFERGVRQSRVRNEWADVALDLRFAPMGTADAADAALRGHISEEHARRIAEQNGLRPQDWGPFFANQGNPPAPEQLLDLWRRRVIDEERVRTGIRQGRTRNEWITELLHLRWSRMTSADALDAWLRGHLDRDVAETVLAENGLDPRDHDAMFGNAGNPLGLQSLLEAYRRGFIGRERFERGFRQSRYRNEWADVALELRRSPMTTAEAIEANVQGHLSEEEARRIAEENGLRPADFTPLRETAGSPLSRTELETLYNRGKIGKAEVIQGLRESRLKNKYLEAAFELRTRLPEARMIVSALEMGAIERHEAEQLLAEQGYGHQVVAMFIAEAEIRATGPHKQLMTSQVMRLYSGRIISEAKARQLLEHLHYSPEAIADMLHLADYQLHQHILDTGITAIRAHYLAHRISDQVALADLHALNLPASAADTYLKVWRLERLNVTKQLTEAQIIHAYKKGLFAPPHLRNTPEADAVNRAGAHARLARLGYDDTDAAILIDGA